MKHFSCLIICLFLLEAGHLNAQDNRLFQYINPKPGSELVSVRTNIILGNKEQIDNAFLSSDFFTVTGSLSGKHIGEIILSDDHKTIVFNPQRAFAANEKVSVSIKKGIRTKSGSKLPSYSFSFMTAFNNKIEKVYNEFDDVFVEAEELKKLIQAKGDSKSLLPAPEITINSVDNPSEGYIFLATWDRNVPAIYGNYIFVLDKNGAVVDSVRVDGAPYDFQVQQNGLLTYALGDYAGHVPLPGEQLQHIVLNDDLAKVDSFKMKNGYATDFHEFKILPNGHAVMMTYHTVPYDMSTIVEGGDPEASLVLNIIQEQDRNKNVVFEWRNIDYIPITDSDLDLTASRLNYSTLNAFDIDTDGNILASFRNHSEIMKISRTTGEILWRMGSPRGEFTYIGEHSENAPYYHSRQHNIHRHKNGNITIFDNGQHHQPPYSRAVEYELDEENKTATLVSEWRYPAGNIFTVTAGNAQLLNDGGWFIGFGVPNQQFVKRNAVEVHSDGSVALEISLPDGVLAYRVSKFPWKETVDKNKFVHYEVREGSSYSYNNATITTGVDIEYTSLSAADYNESIIERIPYGPVNPEFTENLITIYPVSILYSAFAITAHSSDFSFDLSEFPEIKDPENTVVYYRKYQGEGLFIPAATTYDAANKLLSATIGEFGEIVFGVPDLGVVNNIPILYEPLNQEEFKMDNTLTLRWTGVGVYSSFNLQVSTDNTFESLLEEANTNLSDYTLSQLERDKEYFWRVNSVLKDNTSNWSEVWSFSITDTTTSVTDIYDNSSFKLEQNYPNPFNNLTTVSYSVNKPGPVTIKVYNQLGREVCTLIDSYRFTGSYKVKFDAEQLPGGVYYYQLKGPDNFIKTRRMLIVKE